MRRFSLLFLLAIFCGPSFAAGREPCLLTARPGDWTVWDAAALRVGAIPEGVVTHLHVYVSGPDSGFTVNIPEYDPLGPLSESGWYSEWFALAEGAAEPLSYLTPNAYQDGNGSTWIGQIWMDYEHMDYENVSNTPAQWLSSGCGWMWDPFALMGIEPNSAGRQEFFGLTRDTTISLGLFEVPVRRPQAFGKGGGSHFTWPLEDNSGIIILPVKWSYEFGEPDTLSLPALVTDPAGSEVIDIAHRYVELYGLYPVEQDYVWYITNSGADEYTLALWRVGDDTHDTLAVIESEAPPRMLSVPGIGTQEEYVADWIVAWVSVTGGVEHVSWVDADRMVYSLPAAGEINQLRLEQAMFRNFMPAPSGSDWYVVWSEYVTASDSTYLYVHNFYSFADVDDHEPGEVPTVFSLCPPYPNPFNLRTTVPYRLYRPARVYFTVTDILGREVARVDEGWKPVGTHRFSFNAQDLPSGVYIIRIDAAGRRQTRRVTLLK